MFANSAVDVVDGAGDYGVMIWVLCHDPNVAVPRGFIHPILAGSPSYLLNVRFEPILSSFCGAANVRYHKICKNESQDWPFSAFPLGQHVSAVNLSTHFK
jgi:hypothetical protein